jgi:PAS domain S-box-containing protein
MNENILIIDDEPDILEPLEQALSLEGFQVRGASSGMEAMEIFKSEPFDLVITDIRMPQMDGMEVLKQVKQLDESVEVIMLTGFATIENAVMALRNKGAYDYLTKPLEDIDTLLISVNRALDRRRLRLENKNLIKKLETANAGLTQEIEERKRTEKALQESEERFKVLFQYAPDAYYLNDLKGIFIDGNKAAEELIGYQKEALVGRSFLEAGLLSEDQLPKAVATLKKNIEGQRTGPDEFVLKRKDGGKVIVEIRTLPIEIDHEDVVLAIGRDITERKRLEEQLLDSHKMKAITTLAGGVAHEFNNALTTIIGYIQLLEMSLPDNKTALEYIEEMKAPSHRMANLTKQLLAYARGGKYQAKVISLSDFVEDTLLIITPNIDPSIRLETDLPKDIFSVKVDSTQMQMVVSAVVSNSEEAIEGEGCIRIITRNEEIDEAFAKSHPVLNPGRHVCLSVEDNGKGMDKETVSKIFDPFFTTKFQGRGLGMAAVYGIIRNHDGWISIDSEPGRGTVVRIYLPAFEPP